MRRLHPLVHDSYGGLISLIDPLRFENCIAHAAEKLRTQLGFSITLYPVRLTRCYKEFAAVIEEAQDEELTPDPVDLITLYSKFCTILNKSNLVAHTEINEGQVLDFRVERLKQNASNVLAVALTLSLFQDEFLVDYAECQIERDQIFSLAYRMRRTPNSNIFDVPSLHACKYLPNHNY